MVEFARPTLEHMKFEIAQELEIYLCEYNGDMLARDAGGLVTILLSFLSRPQNSSLLVTLHSNIVLASRGA